MKIAFTSEFIYEYRALKNRTLANQIEKVIDSVRNAGHINEIPNIKS